MYAKITLIICLLLFSPSLQALSGDSVLYTPDEKRPIIVNNCILAKVNGKAISVIDLMKKMDMLFYRQFPEYTSSSVARFQYYEANWDAVLQNLIDEELIIADAEECKLVVSNGDIRQEMETLFGPNIIANLDKVDLTFNEAWKMVQREIIMRRMLYIKAHSKALKQVTPEVTRKAYEEYAKANIRPDIWVYQVISFRDKTGSKAEKAANQAYTLLSENLPIGALEAQMGALELSTKLTISEEFRHTDKEVSASYKEPLAKLFPGQFSKPIALKSRQDDSIVYRIFFLKEKIPGGLISFNEVGDQIKNRLLEDAAMAETDHYLLKLRKHFDLQAMDLEQFKPFQLY